MARGYVAIAEGLVSATGSVVVDTTDCNGYTPIACMVVASRHYTPNDGGGTVNATLSIGFHDGTNGRFQCATSENNVGTSDVYRDQGTGSVLKIISVTGGTAIEATLTAFHTNGATFNFSAYDNAGTNMRFWVMYFFGEDASAFCGTQALGTGTSILDITAPGFQPDFVLCAHSNGANASAIENFFGISFGILSNDGSDTQNYVSWAEADAVAAGGQPSQIISTLYNLGQQSTGAATEAYHLTGSAFDASGFSETPSASAGSDDMNYLAIKLGVTCRLIDITSPTATGNQSYTSAAPGPQAVITVGTNLESYDTSQFNTGLAGGIGICAFTRTQAWGTVSRIAVADPTNCSNETNAYALRWPLSTSLSTGCVASFVSMNNDGFTLNWTTVQATGKKGFAFIIGQGDGKGAVGVANTVAGVGRSTFAAAGAVSVNVAVNAVAASTQSGAGAIGNSVAVAGVGRSTFSGVGTVGGNVAVAGVGMAFQTGTGVINNSVDVQGTGRAIFAGVGTIGNNVAVAGTSQGSSPGDGFVGNSVGVFAVGTSTAAAAGTVNNEVVVSGAGIEFHPLFQPSPFRTVFFQPDGRTVYYRNEQD